MKVVLDTNVLVSALIKAYSLPASILRLVLGGQVKIAYDERILNEYRQVLRRPKFGFAEEHIQTLLEFIEKEGIHALALPLKQSLPDPDDEMFLEVALAIGANALVSGNKKHFPAKCALEIPILNPHEFMKRWREEGG